MITEAMYGTDDIKWKLFCPPALPGMGKKTALFEGSSASPACPFDTNFIKIKIFMKYWWNATDRGIAKYSDRNMSQCHTVHMDIPESCGQNSAINCLNHEKAFQRRKLKLNFTNTFSSYRAVNTLPQV
jgi:hypothetical protein